MRCTTIGFRAMFLNFTAPLFCCYFHGNAVKSQIIFSKQVPELQFRERPTSELKETHYSQRPAFQRYYSSPEMDYEKVIGPCIWSSICKNNICK